MKARGNLQETTVVDLDYLSIYRPAHFTGLSPLQSQKTLRLQAVRKLLRNREKDVSLTAFEMGYASPSQFSREHTREFGIAPSKDTLLKSR